MSQILLVYSTTDGHTLKICERIKQRLRTQQREVLIVSVAECNRAMLESADSVIVGASIRYGKHNPEVYAFIDQQQALLDAKPNAFFTVNVVARKPNKNTPDTNPYLKKFLKQIAWQPKMLGVFAGRINYSMYGWFDRHMIQFIMWVTKGPTAADTDVAFTNWDAVDQFADNFARLDA